MLGKELIEIAIGDLYMYDEATGLEYCTTSLSSAEFSSSADKTDVRGGVNNAVLYTIPGEKEVTFTVTDVVNHVDITALKNARCVAKGLAASPGAGCGKIYFTAEEVSAAKARGEKTFLLTYVKYLKS